MNEKEVKHTAGRILGLIAKAKEYSNPYNAGALFTISEELMGLLVFLVKPLMDIETAYRKEVLELMRQDKSVAGAEAEAKAGQNYADWKSLQRVYDQASEQIKLTKKFAGLLSDELKRI